MALRGRIDGVFDGKLRGWLWDPDDPLRRFSGRILLDGQPLAEVRGDLPRPDLEAIGFGEGGGGFEYALPIAVQDGAMHEVRLIAEQLWIQIELDRLSLPLPARLHMLRGQLHGIVGGHCSGWVWDAARPLDRVTVELVQDGQVLARQPAGLRRLELARAGIGDGAHGFAFDLARLQPPLAEGARLELRAVGGHGEWTLGAVTLGVGQVRPATPTPSVEPVARMSRRRHLAAIRKAEAEQNLAGAVRLLEAALLDYADDPDLLSIRARIHLAQQELEPAERLASAVLRDHPGHERATLILARASTALGRHEAAIETWRAIGPHDAAFRERVTKRARSLIALQRQAEALQEAAEAVRQRPGDVELLRHLALTAEAVGAPRAALAHWRRLLDAVPDDPAGRARIRTLEQSLTPATEQALASPLVHAELRDWPGPLEAWAGAEAAWPLPGLRLRALGMGGRALGMGGRAMVTPAEPRQLRPGDLPGYGLLLRAEGSGAEIGFVLASRDPLRMALETQAWAPGPGLVLVLRRTDAGGAEAGERELARIEPPLRPALHRFDLAPDGLEREAAGLELVLRIEGAGALLLRPPRPLSRLRTAEAVPVPQGFECPELALPPPSARRDSGRRADALMSLATPFTSIVIAAPPEALSSIIHRVLGGTAAPFECLLAVKPDWPEALTAALRALAALDPRLRLLPEGAAAATGWVARVEAPPPGGEEWLCGLHREAARRGRAEAPGVLLSRAG
ncbi:tetratricopeptide repeat protein [Roseococcus sp. SDR]|uniref:tetratricopeptide repeat protein n=1 Tax=Roseococcus sp. SDR TaxID=2835532 RepID=UPI001BCC8FEF|nr:tetratricopeptide repeat protein [Roseococcus sp. SDR]MBS7792909.1 tetratricopeptide repeat protein [Roseococcus sp. SDR]MBV1848223.1 tetratricopeptide repeat protein [Roseococcus sp. SDR]